MALKTVWFSDIQDAKERENFKEYVKNSVQLLDKLEKICYNMIQDAEKSSPKDYDSPAWAYKQADKIGYIRALRQVIELTQT